MQLFASPCSRRKLRNYPCLPRGTSQRSFTCHLNRKLEDDKLWLRLDSMKISCGTASHGFNSSFFHPRKQWRLPRSSRPIFKIFNPLSPSSRSRYSGRSNYWLRIRRYIFFFSTRSVFIVQLTSGIVKLLKLNFYESSFHRWSEIASRPLDSILFTFSNGTPRDNDTLPIEFSQIWISPRGRYEVVENTLGKCFYRW